jgi:hypothetical protein
MQSFLNEGDKNRSAPRELTYINKQQQHHPEEQQNKLPATLFPS